MIANFSSRGAAGGGLIKPDISAPGVNVRSSVNGGGYGNFNGTSMASPHVAGAVALVWSAAPALIGDIAATRGLLDATALDTEDLQCGGTADDNNVYGEGQLDALTLVDNAPRGDNRPPDAVGDAYDVDEDGVLNVPAPGVLGNDSDPDGDALTASLATGPSHGEVTVAADGSFTYEPDADYFGSDAFVYVASDGHGGSDDATVLIDVLSVNDAPVADDDAYATTQDTALAVAAPGVLGNDSDPEGASLTAAKVTDPANGTVVVGADGSLVYTPRPGLRGRRLVHLLGE